MQFNIRKKVNNIIYFILGGLIILSSGVFINYFAGINCIDDIPYKNMRALLVSAANVGKSELVINCIKDIFQVPQMHYTMADEGGFQILNTYLKGGKISFDDNKPLICRKGEINITPKLATDAVMKIHPQIMIGLDYPVLKTSDPLRQQVEFFSKYDINLKWLREMADLRRRYCPEIELYLPVQCYNLEQFSYLEKEILKLDFDGLAIPTRNMKPIDIALFLLKFHSMGVRKVHLLGISSFSGIALATYFARNVFERCSIDSTTWAVCAHNNNYILPDSLLTVNVGFKCRTHKDIKLPCGCYKCRGKKIGDIMMMDNRERKYFLRYHNAYAIKKAGDDFYGHALDQVIFETYLKKRANCREKDIIAIINAIRMIKDHDVSDSGGIDDIFYDLAA